MKKINIISFGALFFAVILLSMGFINDNTTAESEEYAMLQAYIAKSYIDIYITIGEGKTEYIEVDNKSENEDIIPIMKELHKISAEGFELVNQSVAFSVQGGAYANNNPRYTFMFKRKK